MTDNFSHNTHKAEFDIHAENYAPGMNIFIKRIIGGNFSTFLEVKAKLLKRRLPWAFGKKEIWLLDFGTGTGEFLQQLVEIGFQANLVGCDISVEMLHQAQKKWSSVKIVPRFIRTDSWQLPFDNG